MTKKTDKVLLALVIGVVVFGIYMIFSASYYYALTKFGERYHFFNRSIRFGVFGIIMMLVAASIPYKFYKNRLVQYLLIVLGLGMLGFVLTRPGVSNVRRWIFIGAFSFQPVELIKLFSIIVGSWYLSINYNKLEKLDVITKYLGLSFLVFLMIALQPSLSSAITFLLIPFSLLFISGAKKRYFAFPILVGIVAIAIIIFSNEYMRERFIGFTNPLANIDEEGWQTAQGIYALGKGRVSGVGLGLGTQNKLYIPEAQNDFILATIGEEFGLWGTLGLLCAYTVIIYRCIDITVHAPDVFSKLLAGGVTTWFSLQVMMNYGVNLAIFPPTGVALPLVSYGGTSLVFLLIAFGIILNVSKYRKE